jgi:hypothetical protein
MNDNDDDLMIRSLASDPSEAVEGADRRKALFGASLVAIEADPRKRAYIDRIAAEAGITDQDETVGAHDSTQDPGWIACRPAWGEWRCNNFSLASNDAR